MTENQLIAMFICAILLGLFSGYYGGTDNRRVWILTIVTGLGNFCAWFGVAIYRHGENVFNISNWWLPLFGFHLYATATIGAMMAGCAIPKRQYALSTLIIVCLMASLVVGGIVWLATT